jgi:hypothetical protein
MTDDDLNFIYFNAYEQILEMNRLWRFDGQVKLPTYEDVCGLLDKMIDQVRKSPTPISIESGGLLVKQTDDMIDVYVHAGAVRK